MVYDTSGAVVTGTFDLDPTIPTFGSVNPSLSVTGGVIKGDVNMSGDVDFADIAPFIAVLQGGMFQAEADCDCSTVVDFGDIPAFIAILQMQ